MRFISFLLLFFISFTLFGQELEKFSVPDSEGYNDFYGLKKGDKVVLEPEYSKINDFKEGYAAVQKDGLWGFVNVKGKVKIEPTYKSATDFQNGISTVKLELDGKWVYAGINYKGEVVTKTYEKIDKEYNGIRVVKADKKYGYIDSDWNEIVAPKYKYASSFSKGFGLVSNDDNQKAIFNKSGEIEIDFKYRHLEQVDDCWIASNDSGNVLLNSNGEEISKSYYSIKSNGDGLFKAGVYGVINFDEKNRSSGASDFKGYVLLNKQGKEISKLYAEMWKEKDGYIKVFMDGKGISNTNYSPQGYIDTEGNEITGWHPSISYHKGVGFEVEDAGQYFIIDSEGNVLSDKFDVSVAGGNSKTKVPAEKNGKWGVYNLEEFKWKIEPQYAGMYPEMLLTTHWMFFHDGKCALINIETGEVVSDWYDNFSSIYTEGELVIFFQKDGKTALWTLEKGIYSDWYDEIKFEIIDWNTNACIFRGKKGDELIELDKDGQPNKE